MSELAATATQLLVATTPLIFFFLASVVLLSKHKTRATWAWGAFCLFAACTWGSIYFASQTSDAYSLATADVISRIAFASGAFTSLAFFFFALAFTERWQRSRKLITALVVVAAALALGFLFTNGLTVGMEETDFGLRRPKPGPLMPLYLLYTVFNTVGAFVLFVLTYRTSSGHKRLQLRYALVAVVFAVIAGMRRLQARFGDPGGEG